MIWLLVLSILFISAVFEGGIAWWFFWMALVTCFVEVAWIRPIDERKRINRYLDE